MKNSVEEYSIEDFLKKFVGDLESQHKLQIHGFDISYVDEVEKRLEIFSYCTQEYFEITNKGIQSDKLGSILLNGSFTIPKTPELRFISDRRKSSSTKIFNKEFRPAGITHFGSNHSTSATIDSWAEYYKASGIRGYFCLGGVRDKAIGFKTFLFTVFDPIDNWDEDAIKTALSEFVKNKMVSVVFGKFRTSIKETISQAIRAAISQVMVRCLSHNLSSHVLNHLTDGAKLGLIDVLSFESYKGDVFILSSDEENRDYQISFFNNYVKCRMDYLSDITFGTPVMHTNKKIFSELFKDLDKVRLLLEYISGLSKFEYKIQFKFDNNVLTTDSKDNLIAFPNDVLGCQAFYNIIENIIRNTAKHCSVKNKETIFTINIKEIDIKDIDISLLKESENETKLREQIKTFYAVEIYDDCKITRNKTFTKSEQKLKKDYIDAYNEFNLDKISEDTKISNIDWLIYNQNKKINQSVLQENNRLRTSSLGLLEMEASASYLRKLDVVKIEDEAYSIEYNDNFFNTSSGELNILKAFKVNNNCLGYRFFVSKPTELLIIGNFISEINIDQLLKDGIWLRDEKSFGEELKNGFVYNHLFVLYQNSENILALFEEYKTSLPIRKIDVSDQKENLEKKLKNDYDFQDVEDYAWDLWFEEIRGTIENVNVSTSFKSEDYNQPNRYNIAFANHWAGWKDRDEEKRKNLIQYLEPLSSNAKMKLPNFPSNLPSETNLPAYVNLRRPFLTKTVRNKLFESAITKVLVIDERIQRFSNGNYESERKKIPNKDIFAYTNVIIPDSNKIRLDSDNFTKGLSTKIEKFILRNLTDCSFLLVHYSILERMYGDIDSINEKLCNWSNSIRVVVTSGRGKPTKLPFEHVCFVNLSPVLNVFVENRSKYAINYLLQSARK